MISEDSISNIISYLPYYKQKQINKYNYNNINNLYIKNINKIQIFYKKSIQRIGAIMEETNDFTNLENINKKDLQTYYILYYEDQYINDYMNLTLTQSNPLNYNSLNIIYHNDKLSLKRKFVEFIRRLTVNELSYIGW
jgi:hypothetical protein